MKYICYSPLNIVIFPEHISHREMAEALSGLIKKEPKSAGYCQIKDGKVIIFGNSDSLHLEPHTEDDIAIRNIIEKTYTTAK